MKTLATVISCSDRAWEDPTEDRSGAVMRRGLEDMGFEVAPAVVVPAEKERITEAIISAVHSGSRIIVTAGGTGLLPRDVTVEATEALIEYEIPGIMEEVRRRGAEKTPLSLLSRGLVGVVAFPGYPRVLIINAPGSRGGARDTLGVVGPILERIVDSLAGVDHDLARPPSDGSV